MTTIHLAAIRPQDTFRVLADATATGGAFGLVYMVVRPADVTPLHVHHAEDETVFVLEGRCTFQVGDRRVQVGEGALVHAPRDVPHRFTVETPSARLLVLVTPGGFERALATVAAAAGQDDPVLLLEVAREHGCEVLLPPLPLPERLRYSSGVGGIGGVALPSAGLADG
jgi:mannose-6-phosphate isomerase-like protein (cupin superfamily)